MHIVTRAVALFLVAIFSVNPVLAQESHVVDQAAIDRALSEAMGEDDAYRESILRLLQRAEVRGLATELELDLRRVEAAVATLEGEELARLASVARGVETEIAGGQSTITVSTTLIIIGLLLLILIIVAS